MRVLAALEQIGFPHEKLYARMQPCTLVPGHTQISDTHMGPPMSTFNSPEPLGTWPTFSRASADMCISPVSTSDRSQTVSLQGSFSWLSLERKGRSLLAFCCCFLEYPRDQIPSCPGLFWDIRSSRAFDMITGGLLCLAL